MGDTNNLPENEGIPHYAPPTGLSVHKAIYSLFEHYCKPVKSVAAVDDKDAEISMDGTTFAKFCRDCPHLGKRVGRTNVDLIFSKSKPLGIRRLGYEQFLDALLGLAKTIYPDEEPTMAFASLLSQFVFGLYEHDPCIPSDNRRTVQSIFEELSRV